MDKKQLIHHLQEEGYLKTKVVESAFLKIPRENFVRKEDEDYAYHDQPLPIGYGQTISAPHMVAIMTELLDPKKTDVVLEIGGGSGYQAEILSGLVKKIYSIELQKELIGFARDNLLKSDCDNIEVIHGDGSRGYKKASPFDKIIVTCAMPEISKELVKQLGEGGIFIAPVGGRFLQTLTLGRKRRGKLVTEKYFGCVFVGMRH